MGRAEELKGSVSGKITKYKFSSPDEKILETFQNKYQKRDYIINISIPEFTCLCPVTGQPDFAIINIRYIPDKKCIESKSLKLYVYSYRNFGVFHEDVVNRILDDCVESCKPRWMSVVGEFCPRGGIAIKPTVEYTKKGYKIPENARVMNLSIQN